MNINSRIMKKDTFSQTTTQKILDFLCGNPYESFYSAQIASRTLLSKGGTNQALRKMAKEGLLDTEKKGYMVFYRVDPKSPVVKQYKVLRNVTLLQGLVEKLKPFSQRIVLFGSCASGEDTQDSDVDIFVVSDSREKIGSIISSLRLKRKIQLIPKASQEYLQLDRKDPVFYEEIKKGIVLWERE